MSCSTLWFTAPMKQPDGSADDFKGSAGWLRGYFSRYGLSMRQATNVMPLSAAARVPVCLKFYATIQRVCSEKGGMDAVWGRFTPFHRFNADEVGVEFGCILTRTAEKKGAKRVWVAHLKHKIDLRECTSFHFSALAPKCLNVAYFYDAHHANWAAERWTPQQPTTAPRMIPSKCSAQNSKMWKCTVNQRVI